MYLEEIFFYERMSKVVVGLFPFPPVLTMVHLAFPFVPPFSKNAV